LAFDRLSIILDTFDGEGEKQFNVRRADPEKIALRIERKKETLGLRIYFIALAMCISHELPRLTSNMSDLELTPAAPAFHLFPHLPSELRLKVWAYAQKPRVVSIRYNPDTKKCTSSTPLPVLLHVNRETRYETQRSHPLLFATASAASRIPFNPAVDTLYFPRCREMGYDETLRDFRTFLREPRDLDVVQRVALDSVESGAKRPWESYDKAVLIKSFSRLAALYLVLRGERVAWLSNVPRPFVLERERERRLEFVEYADGAEAERVRGDFQMAFEREEEVLMQINAQFGKGYEMHKLPPVVVVAKKAVEEGLMK